MDSKHSFRFDEAKRGFLARMDVKNASSRHQPRRAHETGITASAKSGQSIVTANVVQPMPQPVRLSSTSNELLNSQNTSRSHGSIMLVTKSSDEDTSMTADDYTPYMNPVVSINVNGRACTQMSRTAHETTSTGGEARSDGSSYSYGPVLPFASRGSSRKNSISKSTSEPLPGASDHSRYIRDLENYENLNRRGKARVRAEAVEKRCAEMEAKRQNAEAAAAVNESVSFDNDIVMRDASRSTSGQSAQDLRPLPGHGSAADGQSGMRSTSTGSMYLAPPPTTARSRPSKPMLFPPPLILPLESTTSASVPMISPSMHASPPELMVSSNDETRQLEQEWIQSHLKRNQSLGHGKVAKPGRPAASSAFNRATPAATLPAINSTNGGARTPSEFRIALSDTEPDPISQGHAAARVLQPLGNGITNAHSNGTTNAHLHGGEQLYFESWQKPDVRATTPLQVRSIILRNLPNHGTARIVAGLVWGGGLEQIIYTPGNLTAVVRFLDEKDCMSYYNQTSNGIVYPGDNSRIIWTELSTGPDPLSSLVRSYIERECTRCVKAIGVDAKVSMASLMALATGSGSNPRKVEHIEFKTTAAGARAVEFRFCDISHAVRFKAQLDRDEAWEVCNIQYFADPCAVAEGVHH